MREEIEKILKDESTHQIVAGYEFADKYDFDQIAANLQKLFLTKQIEHLVGICRLLKNHSHTIKILNNEVDKLQSELNQLQ